MGCTYLWSPTEIRNLSPKFAHKFGLMRDFTYNNALARAKTIFGSSGKLICTIEPPSNTTNTLQMVTGTGANVKSTHFETTARDQCYPISEMEWDIFIRDEKTGAVRCPMELWAVDGNKYTAPI